MSIKKPVSQATIKRQKAGFDWFVESCLVNNINPDFNDAFTLSPEDFAKKYKLPYLPGKGKKAKNSQAKVRLPIDYIKYRTGRIVGPIPPKPPIPPPPSPFPFRTITTSMVTLSRIDRIGRIYTRVYKFITTADTQRNYKRRYIEYDTTASINRESPSEIPPVDSLKDVLLKLRMYILSKGFKFGAYGVWYTKFYDRGEKFANNNYKSTKDFTNKLTDWFEQICKEVLTSGNTILGYEVFINQY